MRSNSTFLTLLVSFCLSTGSYVLAQPDVVPVQEMVFDDYVIQPDMEVIEFVDDYVIKGHVEVIEFEEMVIVSQVDPSDDGDGENIDMMNENWCLIHVDDPACQGGNDQGGDDEEEEGC